MRMDKKRGLVPPVPQRGAIIETYDFQRQPPARHVRCCNPRISYVCMCVITINV